MENKKQKLIEAFWAAGMCFISCMVVGFIFTAAWVTTVDWITNNTNWTLYSWRIPQELWGWSRLKCIQIEYILIVSTSVFWAIRSFIIWLKD